MLFFAWVRGVIVRFSAYFITLLVGLAAATPAAWALGDKPPPPDSAAAPAAEGALDAAASSSTVLQSWRLQDMRAAFAALDVAVLGDFESDAGSMGIDGEAPNGLAVSAYGLLCEGEGEAQTCLGAAIVAEMELGSEEAVRAAIERFDYVAITLRQPDPGVLRVTRYVIFDEGITMGNLIVNVETLIYVASDIFVALTPHDSTK